MPVEVGAALIGGAVLLLVQLWQASMLQEQHRLVKEQIEKTKELEATIHRLSVGLDESIKRLHRMRELVLQYLRQVSEPKVERMLWEQVRLRLEEQAESIADRVNVNEMVQNASKDQKPFLPVENIIILTELGALDRTIHNKRLHAAFTNYTQKSFALIQDTTTEGVSEFVEAGIQLITVIEELIKEQYTA